MVRTRRRPPAPAKLSQEKIKWTERWKEIHAKRRTGDWATKTARQILQSALYPLTHGKCAFCESKLGKTSHPEIDHYVPKSIDPDLAFEWTNLLPACRLCNEAKGCQNHNNALLKPDAEDPEPYFWINRDSGELEADPKLSEAEKKRAEETIRLCDLQRGSLCESRLHILRWANRWLAHASACTDALTEELVDEWNELADPGTEHKLVLRHVLASHDEKALVREDRRRFARSGKPGRRRFV